MTAQTAKTERVDVDRYLERIGYGGSRAATLDVLREIVRLHTQTIPFENLNPLARLPVDLAPAALQLKLIDQHRGGYCFEHNSLLSNVLRQLGYSVAGLAARVVWNLPPHAAVPTRTHMLLRVELEGESRLVDVGFGGVTLTGVLRFVPDIEQPTPHDPFRIIRHGDIYTMQVSVRSEWRSMYQFDLQEQVPADYELTNWYTSTHPSSRFLQNLVAARTASDRRYSLFNKEFTTYPLGGAAEQRTVANLRELRELLEEVFLLQIPQEAAIVAALERVVQGA